MSASSLTVYEDPRLEEPTAAIERALGDDFDCLQAPFDETELSLAIWFTGPHAGCLTLSLPPDADQWGPVMRSELMRIGNALVRAATAIMPVPNGRGA